MNVKTQEKINYLLVRILQLDVNFLGYFVFFGHDNTSNLLDITEVKRLKIEKRMIKSNSGHIFKECANLLSILKKNHMEFRFETRMISQTNIF